MIRFGDVVIDPGAREVRVRDELRHLEPQAFDVLWLLATNPERVVAKAEILDTVWGDQFVSESALTTRIKEIRRAVDDDGKTQGVVKNLRGTGYRFVAETDPAQDQPADHSGPSTVRLPFRPETIERRPGQRIVHATVGAGPAMIFMPGWISSLDAFADGSDPRAALIARLAEDHTVTVFDRYGTGLSTANDIDTSLDGSAAEITALVAASSNPPVTLFASSAAGPAAILAAAKNPQVGRIVFMCTYASGPALFTNPMNKANLVELVEQSWGMGSRILADMIVPGIDAVTRSVFAKFQRRAASPAIAAGYVQEMFDADVTDELSGIDQPCLILHYRGDPAIPFAGATQLALGIANAELITLDGPYHTPPAEHIELIATAVNRFIGEA